MIGIIENIGPTYIVESVPSAVRAFFIVFIFVAQSLGGVIMLGIFQGVAFWDSPHSWYVPIAVQYLPGIIVAAGTPFFIGTYLCPSQSARLNADHPNHLAF